MTTKTKSPKKGLKKGTLEFLLSSAALENASIIKETTAHAESSADPDNNNPVINVDVADKPEAKLDKKEDLSAANGDSNNAEPRLINSLVNLSIEKIVRSPYQPRKQFSNESLQELADSIKAKGIIQPIVVRRAENNTFELIAGERRWRAAQLAGLHSIPAVVRQVDNETALIMAIVENMQREDLNPLEEARGLQRLLDEFDMTQSDVAQVVGRSRTAVTNLLRLLTLCRDVQAMLESDKLEMGHARALISLKPEQQVQIADKVINNNLSVRETEKIVRELSNPHSNQNAKSLEHNIINDPNIRALQVKLSETLGSSVNIAHTRTGKGKLVINYHSLDELDGIISKIDPTFITA